jgi:hypothetical protein
MELKLNNQNDRINNLLDLLNLKRWFIRRN